jgi:adenosylcobinamide-phosphate synthase
MGWLIARLHRLAEALAGDRPWALRLAGGLITLLLVGGSGLAGWGVERLALSQQAAAAPLRALADGALLIALASALAGRSLEQAVQQVLRALPAQASAISHPSAPLLNSVQTAQNSGELPDRTPAQTPDPTEPQASLQAARQALSWIVGRDTADLDAPEILRAAAETASENAVDGLFAPLFWMLVGTGLWSLGMEAGPGPLALAWGFKAASTLDSMLGYRTGRLRWLGTAGARLDDLLVWLPCRLVALSLPLLTPGQRGRCWPLLQRALADGRPDPSPNAGVSQAAYAHAVGVQLGGWNRYGDQRKAKPLLAEGCPPPSAASVERMLQLSRRLEGLWLLLAAGGAAGIWAVTSGSPQ